MTARRIAIFGSTGSVGKQCLEVIASHSSRFMVEILSGHQNQDLLFDQAQKFRPKFVIVSGSAQLDQKWKDLKEVQVLRHFQELEAFLSSENIDLSINALTSWPGVEVSLLTLQRGISLGLANKESLVVAGAEMLRLSKVNDAEILPMDSEISAVHQCLKGELIEDVKKVILTASGGPTYGQENPKLDRLHILNHPNWDMGPKISVDSATMVNKAFEVIELEQLFGFKPEQIDIKIHPQSIIHAMLVMKDGNIKSVMSRPDMKHHIAYVLAYPERMETNHTFDQEANIELKNFNVSDHAHFQYALDKCRRNEALATAFVVVNDHFVELFIDGVIHFEDIFTKSKEVLETCIDSDQIEHLQYQEITKKVKALCVDFVKQEISAPA